MSDHASPQQARPLKMRNLRAGRTAGSQQADVDEPPVTRGAVADEGEFDRALAHAIEEMDRRRTSVVVFELLLRTLSLRHGMLGTPGSTLYSHQGAISETLDDHNVEMVYHQGESGEVSGFVVDENRIDAERFLGRLFSSLSGVLSAGVSTVTVAPQLGAAFVGDQITDAVLATEAAGITLDQTSVATPFLLYNDYVFQRGDREFQITQGLHQAVAANELGLEFQPRATTKGNRVAGIEAFARWRHPRLGAVQPAEFLRIADALGLMPDLGRRLRDRAAGSAVNWFRGGWLQDARLWLNVSYTELCRHDFGSSLAELAERYPDVSFGIEIKDGPLLDEPVVTNQLEPLRRLDIDIALDNVGESPISIGRLQRLPISAVNLDGGIVHSLVSDPSYQHLAATICEIAHGRGVVVTACQAETREQMATARSLGIDHVQGHVLSEPLAATDLQDLLSSGLSNAVDRRATR